MMVRLTYTFYCSLLFIVSAMAQQKEESAMNKLLAPGPLSEVHAKYEDNQCDKCHELGKGVPVSKCLDCHEDVQKNVNQKVGLHGMLAENKSCISCHDEHKGRNHDTTKFTWKKFDHEKVGWPLKGKHRKVGCRDCHTDLRGSDKFFRHDDPRFINSETSCRECHKDDDKHQYQGELADAECSKCHVESGWKDLPKFRHDIDTNFKLNGAHKEVKCAECHTPKDKEPIYQWPDLKQKQCLSCHEDYHKENLSEKFRGGDCLKCHSEETWEMKKFDHDMTDFKLTDKHTETECMQCHANEKSENKEINKKWVKAKGIPNHGPLRWTGLKTDCTQCHTATHDDKFDLVKYKLKCTTCHDTKGFEKEELAQKNFDHKLTAFELTGAHKKDVSCRDCHLKDGEKVIKGKLEKLSVYQFKKTDNEFCLSCHSTPHKDQFHEKFSQKSCHECHKTDGFEEKHRLSFDHKTTAFVLKGKHEELECAKCHKETSDHFENRKSFKSTFLFPHLTEKSCLECHEDYHKGEMGQQCISCHDEKDWKTPTDFHAAFSLKGIHRDVSCRECHGENRKLAGLGQQCLMCHRKDDIHQGSLPQCENCHHQDVWDHPKFKHSMTRFPLQGAHREVSCRECHSGGIYQGTGRTCITCHQRDAQSVSFPSHIMPQFSDCSRCHNQFKF